LIVSSVDSDVYDLDMVLNHRLIFTGSAAKSRAKITYEDLQKYFIEYDPHMPSTLDRLYEQWANAKGADCEECLLIANLFNEAIDSAKTGLHFTPKIIISIRCLLWSPYGIGQTIIFSSCGFFFLPFFLLLFSSPNLSGCRLDIYHTSTHRVALV